MHYNCVTGIWPNVFVLICVFRVCTLSCALQMNSISVIEINTISILNVSVCVLNCIYCVGWGLFGGYIE